MPETCAIPESHTVAYSRAEQVHIIMPGDCNQSFRLFGGKLMEWVDVVAAVVARRHMAAIADVAVGGEQALGVLQVLHTQRQAVQWRQGVAAHDGGLSHARRRSRAIEVGGADGVDKRVERLDACNARVHQLHRRELARADAAAQFDGGQGQCELVALPKLP